MTFEPPMPTSILLVEDEAVNRALVRTIVAKAEARGMGRFELHEATGVAEARRTLTTHRVRLLLLDVRLPDGLGLDIASEIRSNPANDRPWIVAMSASVHAEDRERALRAGADLFIGKPFRAHELIDILGGVTRARPPVSSDPWVGAGGRPTDAPRGAGPRADELLR